MKRLPTINFDRGEIVVLFHPPTIVKELGMVGLSSRLVMCLQKMQNRWYPSCGWWGKGSSQCGSGKEL